MKRYTNQVNWNLQLQSRKVQFFVVIAIVALLGGGWFTYKSFAATAIYQPSNGTLRCYSGSCTAKQDQSKNADGSKSTINILHMRQGAQIQTSSSYQRRTGTGQLRGCVNARREDHRTTATMKMQLLDRAGRLVDTAYVNYSTSPHTNYKNACATFRKPISYSGNYSMRILNLQSNPVYVATATIYPASSRK